MPLYRGPAAQTKGHLVTSTSSGGGIGFAGLLAIVFIVLKLVGVITWPWIWVLAPIWISIAFLVVFLLGLIVIAAVASR